VTPGQPYPVTGRNGQITPKVIECRPNVIESEKNNNLAELHKLWNKTYNATRGRVPSNIHNRVLVPAHQPSLMDPQTRDLSRVE